MFGKNTNYSYIRRFRTFALFQQSLQVSCPLQEIYVYLVCISCRTKSSLLQMQSLMSFIFHRQKDAC
jgi:hypothetical protein